MTVINSFEGFCECFTDSNRCNLCGSRLMLPFVLYCGAGGGVCICGRCAGHVAGGLSADLIQCAAIAELQKVHPGETLIRRGIAEIDAEERERWSNKPAPALE